MNKRNEKKLKILYVKDILENYSSIENPLTAQDIINYLADYEINAERKSIYDDINALIDFGLDINRINGRKGGFYLNKRDFAQEEISTLLSTFSSSKYVSTRSVMHIKDKLKPLLGKNDLSKLKQLIYVPNRVNQSNKTLFKNIEEVSSAILSQNIISFKYKEWVINLDEGRVSYMLQNKHDSLVYKVYPLAIVYFEQNYYFIAIDTLDETIKHFRLDKTVELAVLAPATKEIKRLGTRFDPAKYSTSIFDMFSGDEKTIRLKFHKNMIGVMIEKFGEDLIILKDKDKDYFHTAQSIRVSNKFFAWLLSYNGQIRLIAPEAVVLDFKEYIQRNLDIYE